MKCTFVQNFDNVKIFTCITFLAFDPVSVFTQREIIQIINTSTLPTTWFLSVFIDNTIATIVRQLIVKQMDLMCVANTQQLVILYYKPYSD